VEDGARLRLAILDRLIEGTQGEACIFVFAQATTNDPPGILIHYSGEVTPLTACLQVGDISHPHLIGLNRYNIQAAVGNTREILLQASFAAINSGTTGLMPLLRISRSTLFRPIRTPQAWSSW